MSLWNSKLNFYVPGSFYHVVVQGSYFFCLEHLKSYINACEVKCHIVMIKIIGFVAGSRKISSRLTGLHEIDQGYSVLDLGLYFRS